MVEILPEPAFRDLLFQIARGRGNDSDVDIDLGGAALALERLIDQYAQDLVLGFARHVADFIDKKRAAVGFFQRTRLARMLAIGLFDPEQFDLHALRRNRRGVDHDKRSLRAARGVVQRARRQFLARAGGPDDQDAAIGLGGPFMQAERPVRMLAAGASCLSSLTSRFSREVSSARVATRISRSDLKGFSMKS